MSRAAAGTDEGEAPLLGDAADQSLDTVDSSTTTTTHKSSKDTNAMERRELASGAADNDDFVEVKSPMTKSTSLTAEAREIAATREVHEFQEVNLDDRVPLEGLRPMKEEWEFTIDAVLNVWVLFNAIVTTMIILNTFKATIATRHREAFGSKHGFDVLFMVLTAFPLIFFALLVILLNNNYAERSFYHFLLRGIIIDFPESGQPKYMMTRLRVWVFAFCFVGYFVFCVSVLIKYGAPFGTIAIILNNLAVGVGLMWFKHQTIEDKFVSLTSFIQSFPDEDGEYDNIDTVSLTAAAEFLKGLSLAESREPCYTGLMRTTYWQRSGMGVFGKILRRAGMGIAVLACCGLCLTYFFFMDKRVELAMFNTHANPCVEACVSHSKNPSAAMCSGCIQACIHSFHLADGSEGCRKYLAVAGCQFSDCPR
jgi:hypothetical protein